MNDNSPQQSQPQQPKQKPSADRTPIPIEKLLITVMNPSGVELPHGSKGESVRRLHTVLAGMEGDIKTEIEHRPWTRVFRITRTRKVTRSGANGKEIVSFEPHGKPFHMPDTWAVSVPVDE